jgi:hypothetical protein
VEHVVAEHYLSSLHHSQRDVQANAVCRQANYKRNVLAALPKLTNLDGERHPHVSEYVSTEEAAMEAATSLAKYNPDFSFDPPPRWFADGELFVPCVADALSVCGVKARVDDVAARLRAIEEDVEQLWGEMKPRATPARGTCDVSKAVLQSN